MRRLNGPQTTGRDYRNLSEPQYHTRRDNNVAIGMRDGTALMADVHRPDSDVRVRALIAASPYPASDPGPRRSHGVRRGRHHRLLGAPRLRPRHRQSARHRWLRGGLNRAKPSPIDPPSTLTWTSESLSSALDVVGDIELWLVASASTAIDTAWIAILQDVAPDGTVSDVTAGWLRASMREVDESASAPGAPVLPCRTAKAVPIGEDVVYRIPLVPNARRFQVGHRIQVMLTSDDQDPSMPAIMNFRHASVGTSSLNAVRSSSRLLLPVLP